MCGYANHKLIIEYLLSDGRFADYSEELEEKLRDFVHKSLDMNNYETLGNLAEFLTIATGKQWTCDGYRGYCQGDYVEVLYCSDVYSEDDIELYGNAAVGCVAEFAVSECPVETEGRDAETLVEMANAEGICWGCFVTDSDFWKGKAKDKIAEMLGASPDEIELILIEREYQVTKCEYKVG